MNNTVPGKTMENMTDNRQLYRKKIKLRFMDISSFIVQIKTDDIYKEIAEDIETRFDTSSYELDKPLLNKKSSWTNARQIR